MDREQLRQLLQGLVDGSQEVDDLLARLTHWPILESAAAQFDTQRPLRNGFTEVVLGEGKTYEQLHAIIAAALTARHPLLATRIAQTTADPLTQQFPQLSYHSMSRTLQWRETPPMAISGRLAILAAGTADASVAEEAWQTAAFFGLEGERHYDVGVAGLHRLLGRIGCIKDADVIIVIAGMEGALPTVVGGLVRAPVIAVPTSVGYGAQFEGLAALLGMLNSCAEGIAVVNIDNGYGAACAALRIMQNRVQCTTDNT